ncbi:hypothetical protein DTO271G3_6616 [Paecilomyces variotii]|nr:hypothetical protein DTO271G3_6616 [Paecilomyces variotii]
MRSRSQSRSQSRSPDNEHEKYRLKVTAGPDYDTKTHQVVPVNKDQTLHFENEHAIVSVCVRVQDYTGYPDGSPKSSSYFSHPLHQNDQYSIAMQLVPKTPINGDDLIFGNDFERPIRDRLPPGFNAALRIVKWVLDPALDGDAYADKPYLYSPALASWNQFRIGDKTSSSNKAPVIHDRIIEEGAEGSGVEVRKEANIPETVDQRRKHFLWDQNRKNFELEPGRAYMADFGNPYLVFNDFSLRLPGFNLQVAKYIDEKHHKLRYVLKNRKTGHVYLVVLFTLLLRDRIPEDATDGDMNTSGNVNGEIHKDNGSRGRSGQSG